MDFNHVFLSRFSNEVHTETQAGLFLIALLEETDKLLAGHLHKHYEKAPGRRIYNGTKPHRTGRKIINPEYYKPIAIDGASREYLIVPKAKPLFSQWIGKENRLEKDPSYFTSTISNHFLEYHSVIEKNARFTVTNGGSSAY